MNTQKQRDVEIISMALVNIDTLIHTVLQKLEKLRPPMGVELLSYKRNRSIAILLLEENVVLVRERGYRDTEVVLDKGGLSKHLKIFVKYEFPRSRKIRIYQVDDPKELEKPRKKL